MSMGIYLDDIQTNCRGDFAYVQGGGSANPERCAHKNISTRSAEISRRDRSRRDISEAAIFVVCAFSEIHPSGVIWITVYAL